MCGRYSLRASAEDLVRHFRFQGGVVLGARYNIAPFQSVPVIMPDKTLNFLHWGIIPTWVKADEIPNGVFNYPVENLEKNYGFGKLLEKKRCLIPADGFYMWKSISEKKQPFFISLKKEGIFAFAGLYDRWQAPTGQIIESCTILTLAPQDSVAKIFPRLPVILPEEHYAAWVSPKRIPLIKAQNFLTPYPTEALKFYPVSTAMNDPKVDAEACIEPLQAFP